jgi:hypothetical protein
VLVDVSLTCCVYARVKITSAHTNTQIVRTPDDAAVDCICGDANDAGSDVSFDNDACSQCAHDASVTHYTVYTHRFSARRRQLLRFGALGYTRR